MNIIVALEKKQWLQVERWDRIVLSRFCENCDIQRMNFEVSFCYNLYRERHNYRTSLGQDALFFSHYREKVVQSVLLFRCYFFLLVHCETDFLWEFVT